MKFRKKPVVIEAVRWDGSSDTANAFIGESYGVDWEYAEIGSEDILIPTLEGKMRGCVGDWIIKGVKGEFYPCKPDIFEATYEVVDAKHNLTPLTPEQEKELRAYLLGGNTTPPEFIFEKLWAALATIDQLRDTIKFFEHLERGWYRRFNLEPKEGEPNLDVLIDNLLKENDQLRAEIQQLKSDLPGNPLGRLTHRLLLIQYAEAQTGDVLSHP